MNNRYEWTLLKNVEEENVTQPPLCIMLFLIYIKVWMSNIITYGYNCNYFMQNYIFLSFNPQKSRTNHQQFYIGKN